MRYFSTISVVLMTVLTVAACADTETDADVAEPNGVEEASTTMEAAWTYEGAAGPEAWGTLSDEYAVCSDGKAQSPVALQNGLAEQAMLPPLVFEYGRASLEVEDTSHGYKATPGEGHTLSIGSDSYRLLQFHPHTPSEHTLNGKSYPMEVHFVHQNDNGELAVVGVMIESGVENVAYQPFAEASANVGQGSATIDALDALLPSDRSYFTYVGSLTTPPCTEGVRWIVLREPVTLSDAQIAVFASAHGSTNRPVQALNGRVVRMSH